MWQRAPVLRSSRRWAPDSLWQAVARGGLTGQQRRASDMGVQSSKPRVWGRRHAVGLAVVVSRTHSVGHAVRWDGECRGLASRTLGIKEVYGDGRIGTQGDEVNEEPKPRRSRYHAAMRIRDELCLHGITGIHDGLMSCGDYRILGDAFLLLVTGSSGTGRCYPNYPI